MVDGDVEVDGAVPSITAQVAATDVDQRIEQTVAAPTTAAAPDHPSSGGAWSNALSTIVVPSASRYPQGHPSRTTTRGHGGCATGGSGRFEPGHSSSAMPRQWHATSPKSSAHVSPHPTPRPRCGLLGFARRTIGAKTSTCADETSPARNASPVASCFRARRAMPTSFARLPP